MGRWKALDPKGRCAFPPGRASANYIFLIGDTLSQWIIPYRRDRKPPDDTSFVRMRPQPPAQPEVEWNRFESSTIGFHDPESHIDLFGDEHFKCSCPLCLNRNMDELRQIRNRMNITKFNNALVVHETYTSLDDFRNYQSSFLHDSSLSYGLYLREKEYLQDIFNNLPGINEMTRLNLKREELRRRRSQRGLNNFLN